jgi:hypothetical protein
VQWILEEFLEGEVEPQREQLIRAHLKVCHVCRQELLIAQDIAKVLKNLPEPQGPEDLYDSIASRYEKRGGQVRVWEPITSWFGGLRVAGNRISYATLSLLSLSLALALMITTFVFLYKLSIGYNSVGSQGHAPLQAQIHSPEELEKAKQGLDMALEQVQKAFELSSNVIENLDEGDEGKARPGLELALEEVQKAFEISSKVVYNEFDKWLKPLRLRNERNEQEEN